MAKFDAEGGLGAAAQQSVAEAVAQQALDAARTEDQPPADQEPVSGSLSFRNWGAGTAPYEAALESQRSAYAERMKAVAFLHEQGNPEAAERLEGRAKLDRVVDGATLRAGAAIDKTTQVVGSILDRGRHGLEKIIGALPRYAETAKKVGKVGAALGGVGALTAAAVSMPAVMAGGAFVYASAGALEAGKKYGEARANREKGEAEPAAEAFKIPGARKIYEGLVRVSDAVIDYGARITARFTEWLSNKTIRTNDERSARQKALLEMKAATPEGKKAAEKIALLEAQRAALREKAAASEEAFQRLYSVNDADFAAIYSEDPTSAFFKGMVNDELTPEERAAMGEGNEVSDVLEEALSEGVALKGLAESIAVASLNGWPTDVLVEQFTARSGFDDPSTFDVATWSHERAEDVLGRELTDGEISLTAGLAEKLVSRKKPSPEPALNPDASV